jgi:hypothetical protein
MKNKALERPQEWHRNKFRSLQETLVKCYLVFEFSKEDGDEYNRYFPFTKEGLRDAQSLAKKCGEKVRATEEKLKYLLPYRLQDSMQSQEFQDWCKKWKADV